MNKYSLMEILTGELNFKALNRRALFFRNKLWPEDELVSFVSYRNVLGHHDTSKITLKTRNSMADNTIMLFL